MTVRGVLSVLTFALLTGCSTATQSASLPTDQLDQQSQEQPSSELVATPQPTSVPATPTPKPTPKPEYPKLVPIKGLDYRIAYALGGERGKTVAVMLAPGVYAEKGASDDLGTLDDYGDYAGLCPDVKRYAQLHPGGYSCW